MALYHPHIVALVNYNNTIMEIEYEKNEPRLKITFHIKDEEPHYHKDKFDLKIKIEGLN